GDGMMAQDPLAELISDHEGDEQPLAILDKVAYTHVNYAEVYWSSSEIRIAFGDNLPIGPVQPKVGLIMSVEYAQLLRHSLEEALDQWSKLSSEPSAASDEIPVKPGT